MQPLTVGIFLFPDYETLDVMGPVELLGSPSVKDKFTLLFVTEDGEAASSAQGVNCVSHHSFASCPLLDVLVVPGIEMYVFSCSSSEIERFLKY